MWTERKVLVTWTNWTFGPWYAVLNGDQVWGIDIGPLEIMWRRRRLPPPKQLHPRVRDGRTIVTRQGHGGHPPTP
jgi:hypothetical protein